MDLTIVERDITDEDLTAGGRQAHISMACPTLQSWCFPR
jgi:hypothetical protein